MNSESIKKFIDKLWKKEYSNQGSISNVCEWEEVLIPIDELLVVGEPSNKAKAKKYSKLVQSGNFNFPPLICINNQIVDGYHRYWAYKNNNFQFIKVYRNIPNQA